MTDYFNILYDLMTAAMLKGIFLSSQGKSADAVTVLRSALSRAELLHSYLGFAAENSQRLAKGLEPLKLEEAFSPGDVEEIGRLGW